jgi:outer membrane receptor protein involved in Fe transport
VAIGGFDDILNYDERINAIYGQFNAMHGNFSYSFGLRTEMSDITIAGSSNDIINKKYTDLFPSASLGYEFEDGGVLTADYSRSINRPEIAQLNPFISLNDERFQSVGNPNLNPYYQDYLAVSYDYSFEKLTLISSFYVNNSKDQFLTVLQNTGQNIDSSS